MLPLISRSLRYYWRTHLGVLAGTMLASAVLTGALLVGDSVDHSLRTFAMMRLGKIEHVTATRTQFFNQNLATAVDDALDAKVTSLLYLRGMAIYQGTSRDDRVQVNQVEVIGVDDNFWAFADDLKLQLGQNETAINEKLAFALNVQAGDEISIRVAKPSLMSRDAPLSWSSDEHSKRRRYTIKKVVSDNELGRFSLSPSQISPYNAFVNRSWLQEQVEQEERVNMMLVGSGATTSEIEKATKAVWLPEHLGISVRAHEGNIIQLESDRIYLGEETTRAALTIPNAQPTLTYLVNSITRQTLSTPYSFVIGGPAPDAMADDEAVISRWLANELDAAVGDSVELDYAELLPNGDFINKQRTFTVHTIREMTDLQLERDLMPTFPGLSDVESCADWDVGMPLDEEVLNDEANEAYWDEFGQTPKAIITLAAAQDMWSNRFGNMTSFRYPGDETKVADIKEALVDEMDPVAAGFAVNPALALALQAVSEAMDFGGLFLGMSFFLIVAELMLTGLLFAFGVQQRAPEMGVLLAMGFKQRTVRRLWLGEGFVIALFGALLGAGLGAIYTRALIFGLSTYWQGAVANAAIQYHGTTQTMILGTVISLICALSAMALTMRRQFRHPARELLTLDFTQDQETDENRKTGRLGFLLPVSGILLSILIIIGAQVMGVVELVIPFFAAGSLLLLSGLGIFHHLMLTADARTSSDDFTPQKLALQNIARRRGRSLTVVALLACGCFMVFAVAAMQEDLHATAHHRASGTGGYALLAESTFPILDDPFEILDSTEVSGTAMKVRDGDDASCLNLNHAQTPKILGVNVDDFIGSGAFAKEADAEALWNLLNLSPIDGTIPALVGDSNTAMWTLKKKTGVDKGDVLIYQDESGDEANIKLVGALPLRLSVFQGTILISMENFTRLFPGEAGHRLFLIDVPHDEQEQVSTELNREFDRFGINVMPAVDRLLEFYSVETTYLAMFLVLGGLGLAVGSVGMGVVVLRNLLERRREIAMLRALGFTHQAIFRMLLTEYSVLLISGLLIGIISAAVSTIPALFATDSNIDLAIQARLIVAILLISMTCLLAAIHIGLRSADISALRSE
ncbi:MAG: FtsX-like permease family protein [Candidatus Hydrogenedentota bacterium]